ncbi:DUF4240 domain-containing protein [Actinomadura kijaniata]|uniref:DUF4240 domain-containing protein n=1 Tax=Actinomadura kijaniata TaxID=46161 RepID=UPI000833192E|nr:DUF4240 domain-containing protein [Actinomadura kijaniata]
MTEDEFWEIIDGCRAASGGDFVEQVRLQHERLAQMSVEELVAFGTYWDAADDVAFDWGVWDAAALMLGGCGDDLFGDFRAWLVAQGRSALLAVAGEPDSLVDLADRWTDLTYGAAETLNYQVFSVYEEKTGSCEMPQFGSSEPRDLTGSPGKIATRELAFQYYPRLAARHYGQVDGAQ